MSERNSSNSTNDIEIIETESVSTVTAEGGISRNQSESQLGEYAAIPSSESTATLSTTTGFSRPASTVDLSEANSTTNLVKMKETTKNKRKSVDEKARKSQDRKSGGGNGGNNHGDGYKHKKKRRRLYPKFFRGIKKDLKRRLPWYWSDLKDGIHPKSIASIIFMFFTSIAPALSFGSFLTDKTDGQIGVVEVLLSTTICGILYAIFAGQPLVVVGVTGPVSFFAYTVYTLCDSFGLPFLPVFAVSGFWAALFHWILAITNATTILKSVTRFTNVF